MQTTNPIGSPQGRFDDSFGELRSYFWRAASLETDSPEPQRDKRKNSIMPDDSDEPGRGQAESSTSSSQTTPTKKRGRVSFMDDVVPDESTPISEEQEREFERLLKNQENKVNQIYRARSGSSVAAPFLPESPLREDGNIENDFAFRARNLRRQTIASGLSSGSVAQPSQGRPARHSLGGTRPVFPETRVPLQEVTTDPPSDAPRPSLASSPEVRFSSPAPLRVRPAAESSSSVLQNSISRPLSSLSISSPPRGAPRNRIPMGTPGPAVPTPSKPRNMTLRASPPASAKKLGSVRKSGRRDSLGHFLRAI